MKEAREKNISGRSTMRKDELIQALKSRLNAEPRWLAREGGVSLKHVD